MLKTLASACVLAVLAFAATTAHAHTIDNRTLFTFTQPITLPGVTRFRRAPTYSGPRTPIRRAESCKC